MSNMKKKPVGEPEDWWAAWEAQAAAEGLSRDAWIGQCCNAYLPAKVVQNLSERQGRGRPKQSENTSKNEPK